MTEVYYLKKVIGILKLLLFPIVVVLLLLFDRLNAANLLLCTIGFLIFFYATEFFLKRKHDIFKIENKNLNIVIFTVFLISILFCFYYIWFKS